MKCSSVGPVNRKWTRSLKAERTRTHPTQIATHHTSTTPPKQNHLRKTASKSYRHQEKPMHHIVLKHKTPQHKNEKQASKEILQFLSSQVISLASATRSRMTSARGDNHGAYGSKNQLLKAENYPNTIRLENFVILREQTDPAFKGSSAGSLAIS